MAEDQTKQFIDQATQSLQNGQAVQALELAEQAVALSPENADAHLLKAIALSQTNQPQAATDAFRQAIALDAGNTKAYFNFAVHLYSQGQKVEALAMAQEAARVDPSHAGARDLILRIESESGQGQAAPTAEGAAMPPSATVPIPGFGMPEHSIPFIGNMAGAWTMIAWFLCIAQVGLMAFVITTMVPIYTKFATDPKAMQLAMKTAMPAGLNFVGWFITLGMLIWSILDILDRKGNWLWIIPQVLCACCGCGFITLPLYILLGRKPAAS